MRNLHHLLLGGIVLLAVAPAKGQAWISPEGLGGDRVATVLEKASADGDADAAATALETLRRRPPEDPAGRARHHYLTGVAQRLLAEATGGGLGDQDLLGGAALSFLRAGVAGPSGGPLLGPALLEAAVTLRLIGGPEADPAADRLLLEAEPLLRRAADPATLARFEAASRNRP